MKIVHVNRSEKHNGVSIERLFDTVRSHFSDRIATTVWYAPCVGAGISSLLRNLWGALAMRKFPGVVHVVGDVHYLVIAFIGKRTILTIHDCVGYKHLSGWKRWVFHYLWFKWPIMVADVVTTISEATKQDILSHVPGCEAKIRVVPNCVFSGFRYAPKAFNHKCPTILQVGTGWNKNVDRVAKALAGIPCQLRVIGTLSEEQRDNLIELGVDFTCTGRISDEQVLEEYVACDMVVFASLFEGFGLPILESQATGRPVVTSQISSMPEAGGDGCCYVNPLDVDSIRRGVTKVIEDENYRECLVAKGQQNVLKYTPDAIARQYQDIYEEVVGSDD